MANSNGDTETSRQVIIRLKVDVHRALRIRVAEEDTTIQQWVEGLIKRELGIEEKSGKKSSS